MTAAKVYADFQSLDNANRLRLTSSGTVADLERLGISLREGMLLTFYTDDADDEGQSDELQAEGVVHYDEGQNCWVAAIDWSALHHASDAQSRRTDGKAARPTKPRKSGIPTGNAGEYFVMGELLRRGLDAQLADRNTKGYDILVGRSADRVLKKIQVKSVRAQPWYVRKSDFTNPEPDQITVFVLLGTEAAQKAVRYFITRNQDVSSDVHCPPNWKNDGFMPLAAIQQFEDRWDILLNAIGA